MKPAWKLYWCTTRDHDEDWFVVARSARDARRYHEMEEGYNRGDASAELILSMPAGTHPLHSIPDWPRAEDLTACGVDVDELPAGRVARYKGRVFVEGRLEGEINLVRGTVGLILKEGSYESSAE